MSPDEADERLEPADDEAGEAPAARRPGGRGCLPLFVFLFLLGGVLGVCAYYVGQPLDDDPELQSVLACRAAQNAVRGLLRAPASAKFSDCAGDAQQRRIVATGPGAWRIAGVVDADNAFGVTLRADWIASVTRTADGSYVATVESLTTR